MQSSRQAVFAAAAELRKAGLVLAECQFDAFRQAFREGVHIVQECGATAETARAVFNQKNPIPREWESMLECLDMRHVGSMRFQSDGELGEYEPENCEGGRDDDVHSYLLGFDMGVAWALKQKNAHDERKEASMKHEHDTQRSPAGVREDEAFEHRADFGDLGHNIPY